jgi:putative endonuclease
MHAQRIGKMGEDLAETYLIKLGYMILERNFRCREGEIDIICLKNDTLICIEVKARTSSFRGQPYEAVSPFKVLKIKRALHVYLATHFIQHSSLQIDVLSLLLEPNGKLKELKHFKNITF